jgi:hypothetical protein
MLREIVVIDDSDEGNESDEESESETEGEEEESSDEVAGVIPEKTNTPAVLSQKPASESQSNRAAKAQASHNQQSTHPINTSTQNQGVASRTRSKTKPKKSKKARRIKRYQAWQDALKRRHDRPSAPKTPFEQHSRTNVREIDETRHLMQDRSPIGHSNPDLYTAPYNDDYQTIYAIDAVRGPSRPMTVCPLSHPIGVYGSSVITRY